MSNGSNGSAAAGKSCRFERVMSTLKEREGKVGEQGIKKGEGSHGHGHGHGHGYSQIYEQNKL